LSRLSGFPRRLAAIFVAGFAALALSLTGASAALADPGQTYHYTYTFQANVPCGAQLYDITSQANGNNHFNEGTTGNGTVVVQGTFNEEGSFTAVPDNGVGPTLTGHYHNWGDLHATNPVFDQSGNIVSADTYKSVGTFTVHATAPDGTTYFQHTVSYTSYTPQQGLRSFLKDSCA
jgi:hypothetical protein